ncbi:lipopolysaccharide biosynthesis protein [Sphingomonas sp. R-74633]|uniref:lipopolysaccharide biosynthesis protein n=1 Tax=Sphingomonas sp. R-74633 TaxID=2751188 RepID=UPI0015D1534D|nr:oligosaccharide flippase family protein [Sphingomonas sp. R-74633]
MIFRLINTPLLRQSALYTSSMLFSKIAQLFSVFVYSYFVDPAEFGFYSVFSSYIWIFASIISVNLYLGVGRYLYEDDVDNDVMISTVLVELVLASLIFLGVAAWVVQRGSSEWPLTTWLCLLFVTHGFIFESLITQFAAYNQNGMFLLRATIIRAIASVSVTMVALMFMTSHRGFALILGDVAGALPVIGYFIFSGMFRFNLKLSVPYIRKMLGYAMPITPYMLSLTLLSQVSRIIVEHYQGERAAGLFSLSYNFGMLPLIAATALTNAVNRSFFDQLKGDDQKALVSGADDVFALTALCFAGVMAFGELAAWLFLPDRYSAAFAIIPVVAYAGMALGLFQIWVRVLAFRDRPGVVSVVATLGMAVNMALNLMLIPSLGFSIAAWSVVIAYVGMALGCMMLVKKLEGIELLSVSAGARHLAIGGLPLLIGLDPDIPFAVRQVLLGVWFVGFAIYLVFPLLKVRGISVFPSAGGAR